MPKLNQRRPTPNCFPERCLCFHVEHEQNNTAASDLLFTSLVATKLVEITGIAIGYGDTGSLLLPPFVHFFTPIPTQSKLGFTTASPRWARLPSPHRPHCRITFMRTSCMIRSLRGVTHMPGASNNENVTEDVDEEEGGMRLP
jgi:hypothetical protein